MRARLALLSLALLASFALAACGQEAQDEGGFQTEIAQVAETEGIYITLDGMKYQVQVSRQMNPLLVSERAYFQGLTDDDLILGADQEWFGIFMRVENEVEEAVRTARDFEIRDTQENVYRPVSLGAANDFAYRPTIVQGKELYPDVDSAAGERPPYGSLLLFKVRRFSLDNRPLELVITGNDGEKAAVDLDV
jgi:hypothetical protein